MSATAAASADGGTQPSGQHVITLRDITKVYATGEVEVCAHCEMPLIDHASFCTACGTAIRVQRKLRSPEPAVVAAAGSPAAPVAADQGGQVDPPASQPTPPSPNHASEAPAADEVFDQLADDDRPQRASTDEDGPQRTSTDEEGRS